MEEEEKGGEKEKNLLIGAFIPFTFRVIINRYVLITIAGFSFVVTKGSRLTSLLSKSLT